MGTPGIAQTSSYGPAPWDVISVWVRKEVKGSSWANLADPLLISIPAARRRYGVARPDGPLTNRMIHREIRQKVLRFILPAQRAAFAKHPCPFHIHVTAFDNATRGMFSMSL